MKFLPIIYLTFLVIILSTPPYYAAHGYEFLNYGIKILYPIFGPIFLYFDIFENNSDYFILHSILSVVLDVVCILVVFKHPHKV